MKWLNDTIKSHKGLGGTLCGRILPPFPESSHSTLSQFQPDEKTIQTAIDGTGAAMKAAAAGVGMIKSAAKSLWGSYVTPSSTTINRPDSTISAPAKGKKSVALCATVSESYYNPNSPTGKARQLERYLNYLLEHPALSTSFPLNTILKVREAAIDRLRWAFPD
jgi:hypothetical protein